MRVFFTQDRLCAQAFLAASSLCCNAKQPAKVPAAEMKGENASHWLGKKKEKDMSSKGRMKVPSLQQKKKRTAKIAKLEGALSMLMCRATQICWPLGG